MSYVKRPENLFKHYHAHLYFNQTTYEAAVAILQQISDLYGLKVGTKHKKMVGPHPMWSCQILFNAKYFDLIIPWLDSNRGGLRVLVHPVTGNDLQDHTEYASWLGDPVALNLELFRN